MKEQTKERKSLIDISLKITEPEYREIDAISYSMLSKFQREGFRGLEHLYDKVESPSLLFGSIVDTMLTDGMKEFEEKYSICDFPELSDSLVGITRQLFALYGDTPFGDIDDETISQVCVDNNYYKGASYKATRVKKVREYCSYFYSLLQATKDKTVITQQDYDDARNCVDELKLNAATTDYFNINPYETSIEKLYQVKFASKFNGIDIKCMFDLLVVDHAAKVIYPCDLKTTSSPEETFGEHSFYKWRYFYQAQLYSYILRQNILDDPYFKDFTIASYRFIVVNRKTLSPYVWIYNENFDKGEIKSKDEVYPAWRELTISLDSYRQFYKEHDRYPKYPIGDIPGASIVPTY